MQAVLCALMLLLPASAAHAIDLNLSANGVVLPDPEQVLTAQTARQIAGSRPSKQPHQTTVKSRINWLIAPMHNTSGVTDWVVKIINSPSFDTIDLYVFDGDRLLSHQREGTLIAGRQQIFSMYYGFALPFQIPLGASRQLVVRTQAATHRNTLIIAQPADEYRQNSTRDAVITLMTFGSMLAFILYALFLACQLREPNYFFYSLYAMGQLIFFLLTYGYFSGLLAYLGDFFGYKELFLSSSVPKYYLKSFCYFDVQFFGALFCYRFLEIPRISRFTHRLFQIFLVLASVKLASLPFIDLLLSSQLDVALHLLLIVLTIGATILATVKKVPQAIYILLGWSLMWLMIARSMLQLQGIIDILPINSMRSPIVIAIEMVIFSLGITARVRQLQDEKSIAEYANRAKSMFLSTMSHEIRTPMHGVLGTVQLLSRTPLSVKQQGYVQSLDYSGKALLTVLDEILDFSKLEAGEICCESIDFEPRQLLVSMVAIMSSRAEGKGLELSYRVDDSVPKVLCGDPNHLRQVLLNLIGNALKFTERGSVFVKLEHMGSSAEGHALRFSVIDTGIGITDSAREHLFDRFTQADSSITRRFGGTGLGLAISRRIIESMGGEISVDSQAGHGSCFYFTIELQHGRGQIQAGTAPETVLPLRKLSILVVDDIELNRQITGDLLVADGHRVELAGSGSAALEKLLNQHFDAVLMDVHMPDMDGMQTTQQLRAGDDATPVIGLTASIMPEEQAQCLNAGMNAVLGKPIDLHLLSQTMMQLTQRQAVDNQDSVDLPLLEQHRLKLGEEKISKLVEQFWESSAMQLAGIEQALQANDLPLAAEQAHRLAGMASSIGFPEFGKRVAEFEKASGLGLDCKLDTYLEVLKTIHENLHVCWRQEGFAVSDLDNLQHSLPAFSASVKQS